MEDETLYEQFVREMEKIGLRKEFTILEEKDALLSDNDEIIYVTVPNCNTISIKGIKDGIIKGKKSTSPYYISLKVYLYGGKEAKPEDIVQFSITEFKRTGFHKEVESHIIYYNYPYRSVSKLKLKKGIVITKDKRLEIKIIRNNVPLKIAKFELKIECDKWFKNENKRKILN